MINIVLFICLCCSLFVLTMSEWTASQIRSPLARNVYYRLLNEQKHRQDKHQYWYIFDISKIPEKYCSKFIQNHQDTETTSFLENCFEKSDWLFYQLYYTVAKSVLKWFMSPTSINGWLDRGSMFIFSQEQVRNLLSISDSWKSENLIDLGAGDGKITQKLAPHFQNVYATEASSTMVNRLQEKNIKVLDVDSWSNASIQYDVISCLNLLDRCDKPVTLLQAIKTSLRKETGRAIIAVVLPYSPYVEFGDSDHKPKENLIIDGKGFEEQAISLIKNVFEPSGFTVEKFTRLPYLCEGDLQTSFYVLSDAVFVLKPNDDS